jgi:hypothetical protein
MLPIIEAFMSQFPTIYTDLIIPYREIDEDGNVTYVWSEQRVWYGAFGDDAYLSIPRTTETPAIYFVHYCYDTNTPGGYFDRNGNRLTEDGNLWLWNNKYATHFLLTDWTGSGVPEIHILYLGHAIHPGHWDDYRLFRFVDGEYRLVTSQRDSAYDFRRDDTWVDGWYYKDEQGNLYLCVFGVEYPTFFTLDFDENNVAHITRVALNDPDFDFNCPDWRALAEEWYALFPSHDDYEDSLYLPGTDIWLTWIPFYAAPQNQIEPPT